jgi:hypothetical protein
VGGVGPRARPAHRRSARRVFGCRCGPMTTRTSSHPSRACSARR